MPAPKSVDEYILQKKEWKKELEQLRSLLTATELEESIKWGSPVYSIEGKNVVGIGAFKSYVGLWFFQGVFLKDSAKLLINAQDGKTKALRQMRFDDLNEIKSAPIASYIKEAIDNQKAGKELKPQTKKLVMPEELSAALKADSQLNQSFEKLSPGKQREYADHISSAKREETKNSRLEKIIPMILNGVGLHDKYKNC